MIQNDPPKQGDNAPKYANDPSGFWTGNLAGRDAAWNAVLPNTLIQVDRQELARELQGQIEWVAVPVRWNEIEFSASLNDGQMTAVLGSGGLEPSGNISLVISKAQFVSGLPEQHDSIEIAIRQQWKKFKVTSIMGGFDTSDDSMTLMCEQEDTSTGEEDDE